MNKLRGHGKVFERARYRGVSDFRLLLKRPAILAGVGGYETALLVSGRVEGRLKALSQIKTASLIGCLF